MLKARLFKIDNSGWECKYENCKHEYHYKILNSYFIKVGTTCLLVSLQGLMEAYCPGCVDMLYNDLRPALDSRLWIF